MLSHSHAKGWSWRSFLMALCLGWYTQLRLNIHRQHTEINLVSVSAFSVISTKKTMQSRTMSFWFPHLFYPGVGSTPNCLSATKPFHQTSFPSVLAWEVGSWAGPFWWENSQTQPSPAVYLWRQDSYGYREALQILWFLLQNHEDDISQFLQRHRGEQKFCPLRSTSSNHHLSIMQIPELILQHMVKELQEEASAIGCHWFMPALSSLGPIDGAFGKEGDAAGWCWRLQCLSP